MALCSLLSTYKVSTKLSLGVLHIHCVLTVTTGVVHCIVPRGPHAKYIHVCGVTIAGLKFQPIMQSLQINIFYTVPADITIARA